METLFVFESYDDESLEINWDMEDVPFNHPGLDINREQFFYLMDIIYVYGDNKDELAEALAELELLFPTLISDHPNLRKYLPKEKSLVNYPSFKSNFD